MSNLKAVFWDVDGTLADTEISGHRIAFNHAFEVFNLNWYWRPSEYVELLKIQGGFSRIKYYANSQRIDIKDDYIKEIHFKKQEFYEDLISLGKISLRIGVKRLVTELYNSNIIQCIVTTSSRKAVQSLINYNFSTFNPFQHIITYEDVNNHKPNPEAYELALRNSGLDSINCLAIEDSLAGLNSSFGASLPCLLTLPDWNSFNVSSMSKAKAVINNLGEIDCPCEVFYGLHCKQPMITLKYLENLLKPG